MYKNKITIRFIILAAFAAFLVSSPAQAQVLNERVTFNVEKGFDYNNRSTVTATLRGIGTSSLIYVEDDYFDGLSAIDRTAFLASLDAVKSEFDSKIYPNMTSYYGIPWTPGIDEDARITLLFTRMLETAGGYFDTSDEFTKFQAPESNERELLYINSRFYTNPRRMYSFIAHELTHLIDFNQKRLLRSVDEEVWLNEMRADFSSKFAGYDKPYAGSNLSARAAAFLSNADTSLTEWLNQSENYAVVNLFAQYLTGKYGTEVLKYSMQTELTGIAALDYGLQKVGAEVTFADVFQNWAIASYINTSQPGLEYVYDNQSLTGAALRLSGMTTSATLGPGSALAITRSIEDWSGQWIELVPSSGGTDTLSLTVTSDVAVRAKAVAQNISGAYTVKQFTGTGQSVTLALTDLGNYRKVVVVPVLMGKTTGFTTGTSDGAYEQEATRSYTLTARRTTSDAPTLVDAMPSLIAGAGGSTVTVSGTGFSVGKTLVYVDNIFVAPTIVSDTQLSFIAPAHADGPVCVRVVADGLETEHCGLLSYGVYADGTLLRAMGDEKVWIIKGNWRRHIVSPRIFDLYGHLGFENVIDVSQKTIDQYRLSAWTRVQMTSDPTTWRIYEINGDATKHWITCADADNCGTTWLRNGGSPDGIYTINQAEMDFYALSEKVFLQ